MAANGRVEKTMDIIFSLVHGSKTGIDYYVSDSRTGIPDFVSHLTFDRHGAYTQPLIPLIMGDDYMNPLAIAAIIEEYPAGVHIIDDGDSITRVVTDALIMLKDMKKPAYMNPITLYVVREHWQKKAVDSHYEHLMKRCPEESGFNMSMYHAIPNPTEPGDPDRRLGN
tara:strand:- start:5302 stop:5805 length:504 start_codon:yes stop_codon:yes gene_type:complete